MTDQAPAVASASVERPRVVVTADRSRSARTSVVTRVLIAASTSRVWESLMFYEEGDEPPPLHLRLLLPRPLRTDGSKSKVGDEAMCVYQHGHLIKRVTQIAAPTSYAFSVIEQSLPIKTGVRLIGGSYDLDALAVNQTALTMTTHYESATRPRWLARAIESQVCHMFHRHLARAIRRKAERPQ